MKSAPRLALAATCLAGSLALAADRPNVKLGLWEFTHENSGASASAAAPAMPQLSDDMLSRLPPEARAQLEALRSGKAGAGKLVMQECLTEKDLEHPFEQTDPHAGACQNQLVSRTATAAEVSIACKSAQMNGETHGTLKWQLDGPTAMHGTMDTTTQVAGRSFEHHAAITGKWLAADCGDVKPGTPKLRH